MSLYKYICPVRGRLNSQEKEEQYRIECINYLISNKEIPKENIDVEVILGVYGSGGRNNLRADLVVYDVSKDDLSGGQDNLNHILYVGEIKADWKEKEDAINFQLNPAFKHCPQAKYAIYWDNAHHIYSEGTNTFYPIESMPSFNKKQHEVTSYDLTPFDEANSIWGLLENRIREIGGNAKNKHRQLLKLIIAKYYDEKMNPTKLRFTTRNINTEVASRNIKELYRKAIDYYGIDVRGGGVSPQFSVVQV